jgi:hypothetical protein
MQHAPSTQGQVYTVFKIDGERYPGVRRVIELLLRKQEVQTTFPKREAPYDRTVLFFAFGTIPGMLNTLRKDSRSTKNVKDLEDPIEQDDCVSRWGPRSTLHYGENERVSHGIAVDEQVGA